jgi:hypothetical protein
MSFERIYKVRLPFDRRHPDSSKNYGVGALRIWFILKGKKGATHFLVGFPTYLPHVQEELNGTQSNSLNDIIGFEVGYHALEPQLEGHDIQQSSCDFLDGKPCCYDGSGLLADDWVKEIFSIRGENPDKRVWQKLEAEYRERFGDE